MRVRELLLAVTLALTPRAIPNPPPLAPIRVGSVSAFPAGSVSHTSKKLDMPAGEAASAAGKIFRPAFPTSLA